MDREREGERERERERDLGRSQPEGAVSQLRGLPSPAQVGPAPVRSHGRTAGEKPQR